MLCLAILLPLIALAGGKADLMKVQTVVNDGEYVGSVAPVYAAPRETPQQPAGGLDVVGKIDTVGGTTWDWQINGNSDQFIVVDPTYGVHVTWIYSAEMSGHADRNMRYNFYDYAAGAWNFIDPANFMNSGINVFTDRSGYGMLDVDPVTGVAYVVAHQGGIFPNLARDAAPGAGIFDPCVGTPNCDQYCWPSMNLTMNEQPHVALMDYGTKTMLFYSTVNPWCTWSVPISIPNGAVPDPQFPTYITKASKTSQKVVVSWVYNNTDVTQPSEGYYRQSVDDGATWADPVQIPIPATFTPGSESTASFHIAGIYPFLDHSDNLHVVANIMPFIAGQGYIIPTEIWHWYQPTGSWSKVVRSECDTTHLMGSVGYNASYASRPTLCQGVGNELVCVWEEFDSMNVEPATGIMRSEIRCARSMDNGATWGPAVTLTTPGTDSKRFPSAAPEMYHDTVYVRYEQDQVSGYGIAPYSQGPITNNPIIVQRFWHSWHSISEGGVNIPKALACVACPNPFMDATTISYELPGFGGVRLSVNDAAGRTVRVLADGVAGPGRYSVRWDARGEHGAALHSGVYFCNLETGGRRLTQKVVLLP
jgi:hypothetical protein